MGNEENREILEIVEGYVNNITFYNEENHFAVATLKTSKKNVTIIGTMPAIQAGETLRCSGSWQNHPEHGLQFSVTSYEFEMPKTPHTIEKFLGSGVAKGIGPAFASKIVELFGTNTFKIIEHQPHRLNEVQGLGEKRANALVTAWKEQKALQELFLFFQGYGISRTYTKKILKTYGHFAIQKIKENPYQLAKDVRGIGFRLADQIAKSYGFADDFPARIQAGIDFALYELAQAGHVCYPLHALTTKTKDLLKIDETLIRPHVDIMYQRGDIEMRELQGKEPLEPYVWTKPLFLTELGIAREIKRLKSHPTNLRAIDLEKALDWSMNKLRIRFAPLQKEAIKQLLSEKFSIVTGGPGTGKSTITNALVAITSKLTPKVLLSAPTGRAAKRLAEITGKQATTVHRLLKFDRTSGTFTHNQNNPIDCDLLIIDEASMLDTYLIYQILKAVPNHAKVAIIGDANQLPSVGPGNVLSDLIASQCVPVTKLNIIFRQASGSHIIVNAHRINDGFMPSTKNSQGSDFIFIEANEPEEVRNRILKLATEDIPTKFGFDAKKEIQVLAPMKKGPCGIEILNYDLQEKLNPKKESNSFFRVGDKVMQIKNNYNKDVFNGDIGYITEIDREEDIYIVQIDDKEVIYETSELDELVLAYAVSVHKYQGSECPCVIMPVHTVHYKLLTRNLLYTGVTRGKKMVILVGSKKALALSVKNCEVSERYTGLKEALVNLQPATTV